ncbi:MAG: hypothetical protein RTV72_15220 [Candidatus Thorarchaeota archaeon]
MKLKAKQGRNQKGLCFISEKESSINEGIYQITSKGRTLLADVRVSANIPRGLIILDQRIFNWLSCEEEGKVTLQIITPKIPTCVEIELAVTSTRDLDNRTIADAISQRVNDLHDDFDGLILQVNQSFRIDRLGIGFTVKSLSPQETDSHAARITWKDLEKIQLVPVDSLNPFNIVCIVEVGAAAQIPDVGKDGEKVPRYEASLEAIRQVLEIYSDSNTKAQFRGFAYSDEIIPFKMFDPQTGKPIEVSSIHSISLFLAFIEWIEALIPDHVGLPSNPGEALKIGFASVEDFETNSVPTILLFFSSGVHTSGPNPVKTVKSISKSGAQPIVCFVPGLNSNYDVMDAIAKISQGRAIKVSDFEDIDNIIDALLELTSGGL